MGSREDWNIAKLSQQEIDRIYRTQQRVYWEADFVDRCIGRMLEKAGICNLPYASLADETAILDEAYGLYCKMEDCNIAYNDTLDTVIDEVERRIANGMAVPGLSPREAVCLGM